MLRLEDCRSKERRLEELKHNLEVCLADATQQIQELKVICCTASNYDTGQLPVIEGEITDRDLS